MSLVMSPISYSSPQFPHDSISLNSPSTTRVDHVPTATASSIFDQEAGDPNLKCLLIPTDRTLEELDEWLLRLGRLKVDKEVVLRGYSLYAIRTWYLSRSHWSQTIVTQTGKLTEHVSAYLLVPDPELSEKAGVLELATAMQYLASDMHAQQRKTEYGTLLVSTPSAFGQDVFPVPGGDMREAKPYLVINTDLRRLGCGGRAFMGMETPIAAIRRKFIELYRLLPPPPPAALSRNTSPTTSPTKLTNNYLPTSTIPHVITSDPFTHMVLELVKIIQSALKLWGMIGDEVEIDGFFCDETKRGIFAWRRTMGMEHEESMRLEKETSGGCIDPKTLAALTSSITSVRYQLDALDVEKVPKDPFTSTRRFLQAWHAYHITIGRARDESDFLSVSSIRQLNCHYLNYRTRYPDAFKVHRFLFSGVASATSSLSANLKGGAAEDTPLRKREHHLRFRADDGTDSDSGVGLIVPQGEIGPVAPPDVITTDLDAYTKGILKSREKDWDVMGARRIGALWSGQVDLRHKRSFGRLDRNVLRRRQTSLDAGREDGLDDAQGGARATFEKMTSKTGQAIKGGLGFVNRRGTQYETSDSDTGGPGPTSLRNALTRRTQSTVPLVIEPDVEEVDEQLDHHSLNTLNPSISRLHVDRPYGASASRHSFHSAASQTRPSITTNVSYDGSDVISRRSYLFSLPDDRWDGERDGERDRGGMSDRAVAWLNRGRATAMLRTSSDGADVILEEGGMEWEIVNPHGTGKGQRESEGEKAIVRRHSLQDKLAYKSVRVLPVAHLAVDVEMCSIELELREREKQLAKRATEMKLLEDSVFKATQDIIDAVQSRRRQLVSLQSDAESIERDLRRTLDVVDDDDAIQWASNKIRFYLSEDTNMNEVMWSLRALEKDWESVRLKVDDTRREVEVDNGNGNGSGTESGNENGQEQASRSWWRFGM